MNDLNLIKGLKSVGDTLVDALVDEFVAQGHNLSGELVRSIVYGIQSFSDGYELQLFFNKYGIYQDKGISASRIPFQIGSGAKTSLYIQALTSWVQMRGIAVGAKQAKSIAFAIARTHKKEGMPSRGAFAFSINGKRTGFFSDNQVFAKIPDMIDAIVSEAVITILDDAINDVQTYINQSVKKAA